MLSNKIKSEIRTWAAESIKYGQLENDYEQIKRLVSEDYPELTEAELTEAANLYMVLAS